MKNTQMQKSLTGIHINEGYCKKLMSFAR